MGLIDENCLTIKQFATLMRVTKDTLIHYDRIGLFRPAIIGENGYRYYSYGQYYEFTIIKTLRQLDIPLEQIKAITQIRNPERMIEISERKVCDLEEKISELEDIIDFLQYFIENTHRGLRDFTTKLTLQECKRKILRNNICIKDLHYNDCDTFLQHSVDQFVKMGLNNVDPSATVILRSDAEKGFCTNYIRHYYRVTAKCSQENPELYPAGRYLIGYHKGSYMSTYETIDRMLHYVRKNRMEAGKEIYEEYLIYELAVSKEEENITKILLPII